MQLLQDRSRRTDTDQKTSTPFIPARETQWFIDLFGWYVKLLARLRFKKIWIRQHYRPEPDSRTIYYLNHSSWWDGLIPLLLNQYRFGQKARAMMEHKQMVRYPFFRRIGAFSVALENPRHAARSLRYAHSGMQKPGSSLFIFPEGELVCFSTRKPDFKKGLGWLCRKLPYVDVVPVGIYIHTRNHSKPELLIQVGTPVDMSKQQSAPEDEEMLKGLLESELQMQLAALEHAAGSESEYFERWL